MKEKTFLGENKTGTLFALVMLVTVTTALYTQGYFKWEKLLFESKPAVLTEMSLKIVFEGEDPELLAYIPQNRLGSYPTMMGDAVPEADSMVLGYEEAKDMASENNITISDALWGYKIDDFLGRSIRVSGMLKKTNSLMDMMHILPKERFEQYDPGQEIKVRLTEEKMPKFFYFIKTDNSNWPTKAKFAAGSVKEFKVQIEENVLSINFWKLDLQMKVNKTYLPLVLGSEEAKMMKEERIFTNIGDKIENFFGTDVVVVGVLEQTNTVLDMMHYMPATETN